jgi:putative FmdB family regulatory protein
MPTYEHGCSKCGYEWEDIYSIHDSVPTVCPNCKSEGNIKRLISTPATGKVELTGKDLVRKLWKEGKDLAKQAKTNDNLAANLYGTK